ncbi:GDYXXLXY domain-containing protein [Chamaesiphon minutus]|uniref:Putative membrane-anchored protein n=1 Tax=Chamaesiphon minutus (strain ATCC 27169 / PCC 6605) TaxID=1173020 RepID=K9UMJ5_CHAP6|nr:GDYXXLXY domain-containing protein [Chamaesiphon minutus]AFY95873.1 putative membrane-anchored protein [Chamaesiphon minutus PCC 6605]
MSMENLDRQPVEPIAEPDVVNAPPLLEPHQKLPFGRLAVPLLIQSLLIGSIAAQSIYALATGTTVVLKTMPVDPYDLLRGYYQILSYDISSFNTLKNLPGWENLKRQKGSANLDRNQQVYVTLNKTVPTANTPQAWKPVAIDARLPTNLSADKIAIRGVSNGDSIIYGLETYYMPEDRKDGVNTEIVSTRSGSRNLLVEVKVDNRGLATPVSLWVGDKQYRF